MDEIRAFVGHSFSNEDEVVVQKFLKYFDQVKNLLPYFMWEHAEAAEPKELAKKVMSLLSDKNLFIGICTKKEDVIPSGSLKQELFRPNMLKAKKHEFFCKTSDWIIQEIGLARGKDLDLILLLEDGVRKPGGLQGDVEYIPFESDSPEKSFGKILEMIQAISPKTAGSSSAAASDTKSMPVEEEREPETPEDNNWITPNSEWKRRDYEKAYWHFTISDDAAGMAKIDNSYLESDDAADDDNKNSWEAFTEVTRLRWGKGGNLRNLKALAEARPDNSKTKYYLARGYSVYKDFKTAAIAFEEAANKTIDDPEAQRLDGLAAINYFQAEFPENGLAIIKRMKIKAEETEKSEPQLLNALREISELVKEDEETLAIMERIVEIDPSNINTRISLAYKHSQCGNDDLALLHYLKIPHRERSALAWNNLGAEFDQFSMPAKSVYAYRRAKEMGQTLAMSNLANKFMSAGFIPEAQQQCDKALAIEYYHKNIGSTLTKLRDIPEQENEKEAEILGKAKPKSEYYKQFGRAASRPDPSELAEQWEGPDCILNVTLDGKSFRAMGSYEQKSIGQLGALIAGVDSSTNSENASTQCQVEYSGTLRGHAIQARVTPTQGEVKPRTTLLTGSSTDKIKVLMVLTDDKSEIKVMENSPGDTPRFYTLKRQETNA